MVKESWKHCVEWNKPDIEIQHYITSPTRRIKIKNWVHGNQHLDTGYQEPRDERKGEMLAKQ